jgi:hypothetical protein
MLANLPYQKLRDAILAHPTMAEGLGSLFEHIPLRSVSDAPTASRNGVGRPKEPSFTNLGHRSAAEEIGPPVPNQDVAGCGCGAYLPMTWTVHLLCSVSFRISRLTGPRGPGLRQQPYRSLGPAPSGLEGSALLGASINEKILKHKAAFTAVWWATTRNTNKLSIYGFPIRSSRTRRYSARQFGQLNGVESGSVIAKT